MIPETNAISPGTIREVSHEAQRDKLHGTRVGSKGSHELKSESRVIGQFLLLQGQFWPRHLLPSPEEREAVLYRNTGLLIEFHIVLVITRWLLFLSSFFTFVFMWCLWTMTTHCNMAIYNTIEPPGIFFSTLCQKEAQLTASGKHDCSMSPDTNSNRNHVQDQRLLFSSSP